MKPVTMGAVPRGFRFAAVNCGLRKPPNLDLGLIVADKPAAAAAVFTQNVVLRLSGGILIPQEGFKDLYVTQDKQRYLYSVLADIVLTY